MDELIFNKAEMAAAIQSAEKHWKQLHGMPEEAFREFSTAAYIQKICSGYPLERIDTGMETGLVYLLEVGGNETVALRADTDAVPTEEGPFHLCGHDAHAAGLLGAVRYLCSIREELDCNVLFIFQPAEEGTMGARTMIEHGLFDSLKQKPVRIFGIHNRPEADCGDVVVHRGPLMSEKSMFKVTFRGKLGHGSLPHKCVDPVVAAGAFICGLQSVISRNVDPFQPAICTINSVTAGTAASSAPETAVLTGYIRSFERATHDRMCERLRRIADSTAEAYECTCQTDIIYMVPAVRNSDEMYAVALRAAEAAVGAGHIIDSAPSLASEDFAVWGTEIPSFFYWAGSGIPGEVNAPWHDRSFRMDSRYMHTAVPLLCASVLVK